MFWCKVKWSFHLPLPCWGGIFVEINAVICTGENLRARNAAKIPIRFPFKFYHKRHQSLHIEWVSLTLKNCVWSYVVWSFCLLCRSFLLCLRLLLSLLARFKVTGRKSELPLFSFKLLCFPDSQGTDHVSLLCLICLFLTYYRQWRVQDLHNSLHRTSVTG